MNKLVAGLLGVTAVATTLVLVRQQRELHLTKVPRQAEIERPERGPEPLSLDRLRRAGF